MLTNDYVSLNPNAITIAPDRQRKSFDVDDLIPSIRARGIYNPIIITKAGVLIAGERRLTAAIKLGIDVPCRYAEDMPKAELETIELEENIKRQDLSWQDRALAVKRIHEIYMENEPEWDVEKSSQLLNLHLRHVHKEIDVAEAIEAGDEGVARADSIGAAATLLSRRRARAADSAVERILTVGLGKSAQHDNGGAGVPLSRGSAESVHSPTVIAAPPTPNFQIVHAEFLPWAKDFAGTKFNFIHCDLPYGVALNEQANQGAFASADADSGQGYESNPEIYWDLCAELCSVWDDIMFSSCHVMFWTSMKFYTETIEFFAERLPQLQFNPTPLIWHKTDGKGILPDAMRGPRNIYEACLIGSCGDRKIVKPVNNVYGCPTAKTQAIHTNEKPIPMLEYFMGMFVDEHSRVLDPTAGSGSAIRTAEKMGAAFGLGLERDADFANRAEDRMKVERAMRKVTA